MGFGRLLDGHIAVMDKYDPRNRVALVVDEWGTWWDVEPGTNPGFLYQQNTLRDAFVAALSLNHFNQRCERIKMANIAQTVNVLQAMVLTEEEQMILTPTYHVFEMYSVHHDATLVPADLNSGLTYEFGERSLPAVSASASRDSEGKVHISLVNFHPEEGTEVTVELRGTDPGSVSGRILTADALNAHNTFEDPRAVQPESFEGMKLKDRTLTFTLPAHSLVVVEVE